MGWFGLFFLNTCFFSGHNHCLTIVFVFLLSAPMVWYITPAISIALVLYLSSFDLLPQILSICYHRFYPLTAKTLNEVIFLWPILGSTMIYYLLSQLRVMWLLGAGLNWFIALGSIIILRPFNHWGFSLSLSYQMHATRKRVNNNKWSCLIPYDYVWP